MSTSRSLILGESYDVCYSTTIYTPANGWEFIATMRSFGGEITAVSNFGSDGFDPIDSSYKFVFTPDLTSQLEHGNATLFLKVQRDFTPPKSVKDIKFLVSNYYINVTDPADGGKTTAAHYQEMLTKIRLVLQARANDGVAEYTIADYGMKYVPIEKLIEMEKYYQSKLDYMYDEGSSSSIAQVSIL